MLKFIEQKLSEFRSCFSRTAAFNWFLIIVTGLMTRFDLLGVTSFIRLNGRIIIIIGDGTKVCKESKHMAAVKKLCQESEDSSKPQFIHGHMFGGGDLSDSATHVIQMVRNMFRELKQQIRGFNYHFWTSYVPKLNKYKKKSDPDPLSTAKEEHRKSILYKSS